MAGLLTDVGLVVAEIVSYVADVAGAIIAQPLLLIPIGIGLLGSGVGLVKRFM